MDGIDLADPAEPSALLGVVRSAGLRRWRDRMGPAEHRMAGLLAQAHGLPDLLARIAAARGVTPETIDGFLEPKLRDLMPDPGRLAGMSEALLILDRAVEHRRRIAIFGDYDVDGACSAALAGLYCRALDVPFELYIPDRIFEGYGPNAEAIRQLHARGAEVLLTVDCGSTSHAALAEAKRLGLDVVVVDHHQLGETLPPADALVNPNRHDDLSGLGTLCAAGVVFMVLVGLNRALRQRGRFAGGAEPDLLSMLDLVALATVADVVPLIGLNRAFVVQGLRMMRQRRRVGLNALIDVARLDRPVEPFHLGFLLGPRINAGGRIGNAALGATLLMSEDEGEARGIAAELDALNAERQAAERAMVEEAIAEADALIALGGEAVNVLVTGSEGWHPGIVGLIAARLKERFRRPAFAFAIDPGLASATGSGRSVPGVDLGGAVRAALAAGLISKGGGHAMAAGATLPASGLADLAHFLEQEIGAAAGRVRDHDVLEIDGLVSAGMLTAELLGAIERFGPYGQGHPEPVFALAAHRLLRCWPVGAAGHLKLELEGGDGARLRAIAFRAADQPLGLLLRDSVGRAIHLAGTLSLDTYGGRNSCEMRIVDAAAAD